MPEARLSVRVDEDIKQRAEKVFQELGLNLSSGINLYLSQVAARREIPFPLSHNRQSISSDLDLLRQIEELRAQIAVISKMKGALDRGIPIALYDDQINRPYMLYPDGQRSYSGDE